MTITIPDAARKRTVTTLTVGELQARVYGAGGRPCTAPGRNPDEWFPIDLNTGMGTRRRREECERRALALCRFCPVALECLELAIRTEGPARGHGVSGGTTPWQRQAIKASRGEAVRRA